MLSRTPSSGELHTILQVCSKSMNIIIQLLQIITLRRRPSDISYDQIAAGVAFLAAVATGYFQMVASGRLDQPLPFIAVQGVAQGLIFYALLRFRGFDNRLVQTLTALFGIAAILQFIGLFVILVPSLVLFGVMLNAWNFYLMIIILKEAIECSTIQSILLTIAYHFIIGLILLMLFPDIFEQFQQAMQASANA